MKTYFRNQFLFAVFFFILIMQFGCDDGKLSNSKVEKILKAEYPRYITSTVQISDHSLSPFVSDELKLLSAKGLATYNYIPPGTRGYGCYGKLTESGSQYFVGKINWDYIVMAVAKVDFDKVLGIREIPALNSSEVEYTEKITHLTPIGEIYNDLNIGKIYNVTATFIKYNDGWRSENLSTRAKKITISENTNHSNSKDANQVKDETGDEIGGDTDAPVIFPEDEKQSSPNSNIFGSFPQASQRLITTSELSGMSKKDLKIMRNEIFARHGYIFKSADMKSYFSQQKWYQAQFGDVTSMLSQIEKQNVELIKKYE